MFIVVSSLGCLDLFPKLQTLKYPHPSMYVCMYVYCFVVILSFSLFWFNTFSTSILDGGDAAFPQLAASPHSMDSVLQAGEGNYSVVRVKPARQRFLVSHSEVTNLLVNSRYTLHVMYTIECRLTDLICIEIIQALMMMIWKWEWIVIGHQWWQERHGRKVGCLLARGETGVPFVTLILILGYFISHWLQPKEIVLEVTFWKWIANRQEFTDSILWLLLLS